jgi:hypothetical protein
MPHQNFKTAFHAPPAVGRRLPRIILWFIVGGMQSAGDTNISAFR